MKKLCALALCVLALVGLWSMAAAETSGIAFDKSVNRVFEGETLQTVLTRTGDAANGTVTYASSNTNRLTVDADGVVTGIAKGQATVTATVKDGNRTYKAQLNVTIARKATEVSVKTGALNVFEPTDTRVSELLPGDLAETELPVLAVPLGRTSNLQVSILPADASNRKAVVSSSDPEILQVKNTSITGKQAGACVLTIANEWSPEVQQQYCVLVVQPVTKMKVTAPVTSVAAGNTLQLGVSFTPENASIRDVEWKSGNEKVATIDENGLLTGLQRGNVRVIATALDGSKVNANISISVTQTATDITLNKQELTLDVGKNQSLKATVLPSNANDKSVEWESSDNSVATVNQYGRITAVGVGTCQIICTSKEVNDVSASATVHVQQPVTKVSFTSSTTEVYVGDTTTVHWVTEPANATNPAVTLSSSNTKILTVDQDGTVHPIKRGEAYVYAASTDGSNRRGRISVKVLQHVEGVHMESDIAYVNVDETVTANAILEPSDASNNHMSWSSDDRRVAQVSGARNHPEITGISWGETMITGVTEDGGFKTQMLVKVGDWDHALLLSEGYVDGKGQIRLVVKNISNLTITRVNVQVQAFDELGDPISINSANGSGAFIASYRDTLEPGESSVHGRWRFENYQEPDNGFASIQLNIVSYVIDGTWTRKIPEENQPTIEYTLY